MQQYVRVEKGRLENAERRSDSFLKALVEANEKIARLRKALAGLTDDFSDGERRVLKAAERLTYAGNFIYDRARGDDTPIPTCAGCGVSSWGEIQHRQDCTVEELIAAVRALTR